MDKEFVEFCNEATTLWGEDSQLRMCIEEMSELTKAICKYIRLKNSLPTDEKLLENAKRAIVEETADVTNTVEQMALIFGVGEVDEIRKEKIARARCELENWKKQNSEN